MNNEIKIYTDDRMVILTDKDIKNPETNHARVEIYDGPKKLAKLLKRFEESDDDCLYIVHPQIDKLLKHVAACYKYIEAAGGVVTRTDGRILLIERLGCWDLPKGKSEKGESLPQTAVREVMEECGLAKAPVITAELTHTYHTYYRNGKHVLKHTAWYTMHYDGCEPLLPQEEEDITVAAWLPVAALHTFLHNTYPSIRQVLSILYDI